MGYNQIITDINVRYTHHRTLRRNLRNHLSRLFDRYSKLLMLRVDFSYLKKSDSHHYADTHSTVFDITQLLEQCHSLKGLVGYVWVLEYTEEHSFHIHAAFYLNGQKHRKVWAVFEDIRDIWANVTEGDGYAHRCEPKEHYRVKGEWVTSYDDDEGINRMLYILSYLSKQDQKTERIIYQISEISQPTRRGRPRCLG
ncbi:YagK/YfjJ domain-containing protein [Pectobacterium aquaticum]|uniref:YagK/YfjJ domain-containing protein n=1 Tax=Pectobacterium aquaticum TaxID=2204145 RepID=UPI001F0D6E72|nr:inovirus-type Gp2 protein [Pectobacterium aquaticum]MCH5052269.1 inovirus-type Gp2 protein [Pectobacterium aquaticum]